jgi:TonB family protein
MIKWKKIILSAFVAGGFLSSLQAQEVGVEIEIPAEAEAETSAAVEIEIPAEASSDEVGEAAVEIEIAAETTAADAGVEIETPSETPQAEEADNSSAIEIEIPAETPTAEAGGAAAEIEIPVESAEFDAGVEMEIGAEAEEVAEDSEEPPPLEKLPEVLKFVEAEYPAEALRAGVEGNVLLEILINEKGVVGSAAVVQGVRADLDSAAAKAVRAFSFSPAMAGGEAVPVMIQYEYRFSARAQVQSIPAYVNLSGSLIEKGTRSPVPEGMVVVEFLDTLADSSLAVPFSMYLEQIGTFEGQYVEDGRLVTLTDAEGKFSLQSLPAGPIKLRFPISGYMPVTADEKIVKGEAQEVLYRLRRESYDEYELVVYGKAEKKEVAKKTLTIAEIQRIPGFGGDAVKVVSALPGVARPSFISGEIIVRGAEDGDSQKYIDGVVLPRVYHFGGLKSVYPSTFLEAVDFYPGGFGVRYGDVTAGIIELRGRPGKTDRWHGEIDVNFFDASLAVEGPIMDSTLTLQTGGRYSYLGPTIEAATKELPTSIVPYYWDAMVRMDYQPGGEHDYFLTLHSTKDRLDVISDVSSPGSEDIAGDSSGTSQLNLNSLNLMMLAGAETPFAKVWKNELSLSLTQQVDSLQAFGFANTEFDLLITQFKDEVQFKPSEMFKLHLGLDMSYAWVEYHLRIMSGDGPVRSDLEQNFSNLGAYVESEIKPFKNWLLIPGVRYDYFNTLKAGEPGYRLSTRWEYIPGLTMKGAFGTYSQMPVPRGQSIDSTWGNPDLPPTTAWHSVIGHEWQINDLISLDVQGYYNFQDNIAQQTTQLDPTTGEAYNYLPQMDGRMYGVETMLRHDRGKRFFGWIAYTLSRSERRSPEPYTGSGGGGGQPTGGVSDELDWDENEWVIYEKDQTHNFQLVTSWRLPYDWETGFKVRYVTGNPQTPLEAYTDDSYLYNADQVTYVSEDGEPFSERMDPFFQIDFRVDKNFIYDSWMLGVYLDVQNLNYFFYNSPESYSYNYDGSEREVVGSLILPTIGINAKF